MMSVFTAVQPRTSFLTYVSGWREPSSLTMDAVVHAGTPAALGPWGCWSGMLEEGRAGPPCPLTGLGSSPVQTATGTQWSDYFV